MRKNKAHTLLALAIPFFIAVLASLPGCYSKDKGNSQPVNTCQFEGLECPTAQRIARDYQIELLSDSTQIWQGERLVATVHYSSSIDSVLLLDNQ